MPQSWLRWTHHLLRTVGRHAHRGLWDGQDEPHTSFPWPSGENSGGVFLGASCGILMRTWYHSNCRSWVPSGDDLPVLVMGNCEILGQQRDSSQPVNSRIWRDLVTPTEALRTPRPLPRQPRPPKVGATLSCASVSKLKAVGPWHGSPLLAGSSHCTSFASGTSISMFVEANWMKLNHSS